MTKTIMTNWCVTRTAGSSTFSYVEDWKLEKQQTASHDSHWDISEPYILQTDHPKSQTRQSPHPSESKQQQKDCEWSIPVKKFQVPNGSGVAHSHSKSILADTSTKKTLTKCVKSTIDQGALQRTKTLLMIGRSNFSRDLEQQLAFMIFIPLSLWFISAACQPELCLGSQKTNSCHILSLLHAIFSKSIRYYQYSNKMGSIRNTCDICNVSAVGKHK